MNEAKTVNDSNRLLAILDGYADEFNQKAALIRSVGRQLIALAGAHDESGGSVEWIARTTGEKQSLGVELALRGTWLDIGFRDARCDRPVRPRWPDGFSQGEDVPF
jgi:hypothetical protein